MARGVEALIDLYRGGMSIPEVAASTGTPRSTVRFRLKAAGVLRSRSEGLRGAGARGRLGSGMRGQRRVFSDAHKQAISESRAAWARVNARGTRITSAGYLEYIVGVQKGRHVHVVLFEERIGRRLRDDEVVHHIDGNKLNNSIHNLALLTRSAHTRLHRREIRFSKQEKF